MNRLPQKSQQGVHPAVTIIGGLVALGVIEGQRQELEAKDRQLAWERQQRAALTSARNQFQWDLVRERIAGAAKDRETAWLRADVERLAKLQGDTQAPEK